MLEENGMLKMNSFKERLQNTNKLIIKIIIKNKMKNRK